MNMTMLPLSNRWSMSEANASTGCHHLYQAPSVNYVYVITIHGWHSASSRLPAVKRGTTVGCDTPHYRINDTK